jgi:hypothetical protein
MRVVLPQTLTKTIANPYEPPSQDHDNDSQTVAVASPNTTFVRAWAFLALLAHAMLAFQWAFTSWVPWITPSRGIQVSCASIGVAIHGYVLWAASRRRLPIARFFTFAFGLSYLVLSLVLFYATSRVTRGMLQRDEQRYQQHLESIEEIRAKRNSNQK